MGKILCACMLMIFVNMSSRTVFAQSHYMEIDSLLIHYVDFNLMTMIDIGCDNFESALAYKTVVLRDSSCIAELADILLEEKSGLYGRMPLTLYKSTNIIRIFVKSYWTNFLRK